MYIDWNNREVEDSELDDMREQAEQSRQEQALLNAVDKWPEQKFQVGQQVYWRESDFASVEPTVVTGANVDICYPDEPDQKIFLVWTYQLSAVRSYSFQQEYLSVAPWPAEVIEAAKKAAETAYDPFLDTDPIII